MSQHGTEYSSKIAFGLGVLLYGMSLQPAPPARAAEPAAAAAGRCTGHVQSPLLREASGMVASRQNRGILWMHNDSGDSARLFALTETGALVAIFTVTGASARDWEDIALGPALPGGQDHLYIADTGDNGAKRPEVVVYRVPEPRIDRSDKPLLAATSPAEALRLRYPDGPHDTETLLQDPLTGDLYLITKRDLFSRVYRAAYPQSTEQATLLKLVTLMPWGSAVGGDVSPDGQRILVRGYNGAALFRRPAATAALWQAFRDPFTTVPLEVEPQGEAICFDALGEGYYTVSEGKHQPIYAYPLKPSDVPAPKPSP